MTWWTLAVAVVFGGAANYWCLRCKRAEELLAEAAARLSFCRKSPVDDDVCKRALHHLDRRPGK